MTQGLANDLLGRAEKDEALYFPSDLFFQDPVVAPLIDSPCEQKDGARETRERFDQRPDVRALGIVVKTDPVQLADKFQAVLQAGKCLHGLLDRF